MCHFVLDRTDKFIYQGHPFRQMRLNAPAWPGLQSRNPIDQQCAIISGRRQIVGFTPICREKKQAKPKKQAEECLYQIQNQNIG